MLTVAGLVRSLTGCLRDRRGVAMIELAITLPLIVALFLPLVDLGMGFYRKTQLMTAAEAGAQYAWRKGFSSASIQTAVQNATSLGVSAMPAGDITVTLSCKCVDKTNSAYTATSPAVTPAAASDCTSKATSYCSYNANNIAAAPGAYVTVTISPAAACSSSSTDAVCFKPLFTYSIFGGPVTLTAASTVRVSS